MSSPHDFVEDRTHDGRKFRMLKLVDEVTHECLAIRVARKLKATDVIDALSDLLILRGVPGHIRSGNGRSSWPRPCRTGSQPWAPRRPTSSPAHLGIDRREGLRGKLPRRLRDELLNGEILYSLRKAEITIESGRRHTNTVRPHASPGYKPPAPEVLTQTWPPGRLHQLSPSAGPAAHGPTTSAAPTFTRATPMGASQQELIRARSFQTTKRHQTEPVLEGEEPPLLWSRDRQIRQREQISKGAPVGVLRVQCSQHQT